MLPGNDEAISRRGPSRSGVLVTTRPPFLFSDNYLFFMRLIPERNYINDPNDATDIEYTTPNYRRRVTYPIKGNLTNPLDV